MNAAVTQQFSSDLETFFDDNACSYELCTGILYQGCQSFQRFSVCQEIIDQENFVSFSQKFFGNNDIINSSMGERFYFCANTTGTLKISATTQAIPIPDASMVRIFVISSPAKRR